MKHRKLYLVAVVVICVSAAIFWPRISQKKDGSATSRKSAESTTEANKTSEVTGDDGKTLKIVGIGDIIAHDALNLQARKSDGTYDYLQFMTGVKPVFGNYDIRFCNQATPAGGERFGISGYPIFNAPIDFARDIEQVGCNVINIGTNHTNDKGQSLVDATVAAWDNRPVLAVVGANRSEDEQDKVRVFESSGLKIGFLSYVTYNNTTPDHGYTVNTYSDELFDHQITKAREAGADIIIVSMRWGTEYSSTVDDRQRLIAQHLASKGVDVVFGHGPHVLEPVQQITNADGHQTVVWYSLGNFLSTQTEIESLIGGFAEVDIDVATKKIVKLSFIPTYMHYEWTAEQKSRQSAEDLLARHNLKLGLLADSSDLIAQSLNNTTAEAQKSRVTQLLNSETPVEVKDR